MTKEILLGIDLGTTNSVIAYNVSDDDVDVVRDLAGRALYPSVVAYKGDKVYTGYAASVLSDEYAVFSVKRLLGRKWNDQICKMFMHDIEAGPNDNIYINVAGQWITPEKALQDILYALKQRTESILRVKCHNIVITVPARFDDKSRNLVRDAANAVGFKVLRIINEPTAAAIGYDIQKHDSGIYGVYDLGGGTFDFSLMSIGQNTYHVLATGGSLEIGGDDFDHIINKFLKLNDLQIARKIKEKLSFNSEVQYNTNTISRKQFTNLSKNLIKSTIDIVKSVIDDAAVDANSMKGILLVGGATRMNIVQNEIKKQFPNAKIYNDHDPDEVVAIGAAKHASSIRKEKKHLLVDVLPLPIGIEVIDGGVDIVLPKQSPLPISASRLYTTAQSGQTSIHFNIVQGEKHLAKNCISLGVFELNDITPMNKHQARIKVDFHVDINGMLHVFLCEDGKHDKKNHIRINTRSHKIQHIDNYLDDLSEWIMNKEKYELQMLHDEINHLVDLHSDLYSNNESRKMIDDLNYSLRKIQAVNQIDELEDMKKEIYTIFNQLKKYHISCYEF